MIEYKTAGESHGKGYNVIISGIPAGLELQTSDIDFHLARRQTGYGRGARMKTIEKDHVRIISGVRWGETIGSPVSFFIENKDWENWGSIMSEKAEDRSEEFRLTKPRPGHADLPGLIKYGREDLRDVLERASARETVARVAAGSVCIKLLSELGIRIHSFTKEIGGIRGKAVRYDYDDVVKKTASSAVRCLDKEAEKEMIKAIDKAKEEGDTLGGVFTVVVWGLPPGFGSYDVWEHRLDGRFAKALMSVPAVKGVEIGRGFRMATLPGSKVHDPIYYDEKLSFYRKTNNAGGVEGGVSNGMPVFIRAAIKPIPSLMKPLKSADIKTKENTDAQIVRSDVCVVPAAGVIGEAVIAVETANAVMEKLGGDCMEDLLMNFKTYCERIREYWRPASQKNL
ncbi:MAG: chorismate synthase [Elusimicrobia bacterium CG03_land_8_20_14_0_80_50_18]|nr:MAG: chorismate synthase [Elusimicrobia bacterium CG03_land_8_20_14_0_80_50_18]